MQRWLVLTSFTAALLGCGESTDSPGEEQRPALSAEQREVRMGRRLYRRYCALCHGRDGEGYAADDAPSLVSPEWLRSASDDFILSAISEGRPGTAMSAWSTRAGGPLRDVQMQAILRWLRTHQARAAVDVDAEVVDGEATRGRPIYLRECARCHGLRGEGRDAVALSNPALLEHASDGFLRFAVTHGRTGTRMPAFADRLSSQEIDDVVAFVRSFEDGAAALPVLPEVAPEIPSLDTLELVVNPDGPAPDFTLRAERFVPAAEVHRELERGARMVLLDARPASDWLRGRIPGALPVPFHDLNQIIEGLPRDGTYMVAYCGCPHAASGRVVNALRAAGFTRTAVLDEGIHHWQEQEYPMEEGLPPQP